MRKSVLATCAFLLALAGCARGPERRFDIVGRVVSVDRSQGQVTLDHEEIKGYMGAMVMPYAVKDAWAWGVLAPGQTVRATLVVRGDRSWIEGLSISQAEPSRPSSVARSPEPAAGDAVPDFALVNQDGRRIHLGQYRGLPLVVSFIYTSCPLPDYCPRTSANFAALHAALGAKAHLLLISFDPDGDTPAVLRAYGRRYLNPPEFGQWEFATGTPEEIRKVAVWFGLSYWKESGQIVHSLRTALVGPDGRIRRVYTDNRWTPAQVVAELGAGVSQ